MKFAYLIFAHQQPELFIRLIKKIDSAESIFFIHIDKRVDIAPFKEIEKFIAVRKIVWIKRASIVWAGFNQIRVTLAGLRAVLDYPEKISHVTFISGQDYPVKPILEYHRYLSQSNEANFIEYSSLPRPNWANGGLDRIHYYHLLFTKFRLAFPIISYLKIKLPFTAQNKYTLLRKVVNYLPSSKNFLENSLPVIFHTKVLTGLRFQQAWSGIYFMNLKRIKNFTGILNIPTTRMKYFFKHSF